MYHTTAHITHSEDITIRLASPAQADQVRRIAERDSARVPSGDLLVAVVGDEVRAAVSIGSGEAVADPFQRTDGLVSLLSERAAQLRGDRPTGLRARFTARNRGDAHARAGLRLIS
jgi:hypothetical protein